MDNVNECCAYCGCPVSEPDRVPAVDDDEGWAEVADDHCDYCEWVRTRSYRRPEAESDE